MATAEIRTDLARTVASGLTMLAWNPQDNATVVRDVARRAQIVGEAEATGALLDSIVGATSALSELFRTTAERADGVDVFSALGRTAATAARLDGLITDDLNAVTATVDFNSAMILAAGDPPAGPGTDRNAAVDAVSGFLLGDLANLWNGGGEGVPTGQIVAGGIRVGRTGAWALDRYRSVENIPLFNNGLVGRRLSDVLQWSDRLAPAGRWLSSPAGSTFLRRVGVVGGVYGTVTGGWEVIQHGNPVDAYREHGAGYVADVAGTAFSASSTAFLLAPNPATATAVVVTGVVWAGAEIWDHREEIAEWTSEQWDRVVDGAGWAWDHGTAVVGASWDATVSAAGDAHEFVIDVGSDAWDAGTAAFSTAFSTGADVVGTVGSAVDPRSWF